MAQRLLACTGCHGKDGRAASDGYYPRIAGKPAGYLFRQLRAFRDGQRRYALMGNLLAPLDDAYLQDIAAHFATLELPYAAPPPSRADAATLRQGQTLAQQGDAARGIPACQACHGSALTGVGADVPGLLGLPVDYLNAQLGAWRTGARRAEAPDCMAQIAQRLSPQDVNALAHWLAAQPVPAQPMHRSAGPGAAALRQHGRPAMKRALSRPGWRLSLRAGRRAVVAERARRRRYGCDADRPATAPPCIDRGAYLARAGNCQDCHTPRGAAPYSGGRGIPTPFGTVYSTQPDARCAHRHRRLDADRLPPRAAQRPLARRPAALSGLSLRQLHAASAPRMPTRSSPSCAACRRWPSRTGRMRCAFPTTRRLALAVWRALYFRPGRFEPQATQTVDWNRGAYLVQGLGHCSACHAGRNALGATRDAAALAGGLIPLQNWYAPAWRAQAGRQALAGAAAARRVRQRGAARADGRGGAAQHAAPEATPDLSAMALYLQSLPQADAPRARADPPDAGAAAARCATLRRRGARCATATTARARSRAYVPLAGNRAVQRDPPANLVQVVLGGAFPASTAGNPRPFGMPPFATELSDEDVAAVLSYIRNAWGNRAAAVQPLDVQRWRSSVRP